MKEESKDNLSIMTYTLNSGIKETVPISPTQIDEWIECFKNKEPYVLRNGAEIAGLNPLEIASFKVHNKFSTYYSKIQPVRKDAVLVDNQNYRDESDDITALAEAFKKIDLNAVKELKADPELFLLDCKCGCYRSMMLGGYAHKIKCKFCNEYNYRDVSKGKVRCTAGEANLLTNKYYVDKQKALDHVNFLKKQKEIN